MTENFETVTTDSRTFADYGVRQDISDALAEKGITTPFPIQALTLPVALSGHDIIGQAKTGTGSTLVSVDKSMKVYDTTRVHGAVLTRARVEEIAMKIHSVPMDEREKIVGLPPKRKDVVVGAALLMCEVMDFLGAAEITVSESDNQEGYLKLKLGQIS